MKAMIEAAAKLDAPVIVQTSTKTIVYYSHETLAGWFRELAENSPVLAALHLDHGKDLDMIKKCIETGWTSVMIDAGPSWRHRPAGRDHPAVHPVGLRQMNISTYALCGFASITSMRIQIGGISVLTPARGPTSPIWLFGPSSREPAPPS